MEFYAMSRIRVGYASILQKYHKIYNFRTVAVTIEGYLLILYRGLLMGWLNQYLERFGKKSEFIRNFTAKLLEDASHAENEWFLYLFPLFD